VKLGDTRSVIPLRLFIQRSRVCSTRCRRKTTDSSGVGHGPVAVVRRTACWGHAGQVEGRRPCCVKR